MSTIILISCFIHICKNGIKFLKIVKKIAIRTYVYGTQVAVLDEFILGVMPMMHLRIIVV